LPGVAAAPPVNGGGVSSEWLAAAAVVTQSTVAAPNVVVVRSPEPVVVRSPVRTTLSTAGLGPLENRETFGQDLVRGRETRAHQETRAQWQAALVDLLAKAIVADKSRLVRFLRPGGRGL
jgi:hypothetical protein